MTITATYGTRDRVPDAETAADRTVTRDVDPGTVAAARDQRRHAIRSVTVAVATWGHADHIARCIRSVDRAAVGAGLPTWLVIAADGCTDETAAVAQRVPVEHCSLVVIEAEWGSTLAARGAAVAVGLDCAGDDPEQVWLAHTEGDATVAESWVIHQLGLAHHHDVVCDPVGAEPIGVRGDAYSAVGGWCGHQGQRDHGGNSLLERLREAGFRIAPALGHGPTAPAGTVHDRDLRTRDRDGVDAGSPLRVTSGRGHNGRGATDPPLPSEQCLT